jgi:hypothetical protein
VWAQILSNLKLFNTPKTTNYGLKLFIRTKLKMIICDYAKPHKDKTGLEEWLKQ